MNIQEALKSGIRRLKNNKIKTASLDSEILLSQVLNKDRSFIILNSKKNITKEDLKSYNRLIDKRSLGKPLAYITEKKEFWSYEFKISNDVLIPRPETEFLVENILKLTKNKNKLQVLDIGVGSGCILLTILKEKKNFYGTGIDISKKCLDICRINTNKLNIFNRTKFFKSDIDNFNYGKYDLIISNPPYIKKLDLKYLDRDVIDFEPKLALDGGLEGLSAIRKTINKSS